MPVNIRTVFGGGWRDRIGGKGRRDEFSAPRQGSGGAAESRASTARRVVPSRVRREASRPEERGRRSADGGRRRPSPASATPTRPGRAQPRGAARHRDKRRFLRREPPAGLFEKAGRAGAIAFLPRQPCEPPQRLVRRLRPRNRLASRSIAARSAVARSRSHRALAVPSHASRNAGLEAARKTARSRAAAWAPRRVRVRLPRKTSAVSDRRRSSGSVRSNGLLSPRDPRPRLPGSAGRGRRPFGGRPPGRRRGGPRRRREGGQPGVS